MLSSILLTGDFRQVSRIPADLLQGLAWLVEISANAELLVDCFAICDDEPQFAPAPSATLPSLARGNRSLLLQYPSVETAYGLRWSEDETLVRRYAVDDFNHTLLYEDSVRQTHLPLEFFERGGSDCHAEAFLQPLRVEPRADRWLYAVVADGSPAELPARLAAFDFARAPEFLREAETHFVAGPQSPLRFSQERMAAVLLSNVVYPTYFCGRHVRHHTPGRLWNSLYTWDSGFIGLGLLEIDTRRAVENLNAYLTAPGDPDNAFVHHGSPVPVQLYLLYELWNRIGDHAFQNLIRLEMHQRRRGGLVACRLQIQREKMAKQRDALAIQNRERQHSGIIYDIDA